MEYATNLLQNQKKIIVTFMTNASTPIVLGNMLNMLQNVLYQRDATAHFAQIR